ncbi:MAG: AAA family ATPase [Desulfovibrionaceae bacterium]
MITRLVLENFMAHGRTELELGPGVTVLTGPNNIGKSAVVEALRCLVSNSIPHYYIRHGADAARVEVTLEDGTRVAWVRKERHAMYEVHPAGADPDAEPEKYYKFGRNTPEDVAALLRLAPVELEPPHDPVDVHIGNQRYPIFLLDRPGTALAAFFAASSEAAHLLTMQNLLKNRVQRAKVEERTLATRMADIERGLDRLAPLPDIELALGLARDLDAAVRAGRAEEPRMQAMAVNLVRLRRERTLLDQRLAVCAPLRPAPELFPAAALAALVARQARTAVALAAATARAAAFAPLAVPPSLFDATGLERRAMRLCATIRTLAVARAAHAALALLRPAPELFAAAPLAGHLRRRAAVADRIAAQRRAVSAVPPLAAPPALLEVAPLQRTLAAVRAARERVAAQRRALAAREAELAAATQAMHQRIQAIGHCPLCGAGLDAAHFLEGGHEHV